MKSEPKAFASLSSGLLARKGAARPAMRPQGFGQGASGPDDLGWNDMGFEAPKPASVPARDANHDGFGDEIAELPPRSTALGLTPIDSPVHNQQAEIAGRLSTYTPDDGGEEEDVDDSVDLYQPEPEVRASEAEAVAEAQQPAPVAPITRRAPTPRAAAGGKAKAAFTLRLDPERHLKLRLACAINGQSAQMLVTQAVDQLLASMPQLDAMARKAKPKG
ncbi:MAG: hypothetical protein M3438_08890 [Pseudomonadota bacterium]|nr:hypothetical protein [Sphingomonas sp.]MDQ3479258.1 hypothetical protein [Pseudomonadota bacterium]